ncbi:protein of unknown function [Glycomyces sambucus]|uniref:DUF4333 domain-containing protein n=1 Tax=Glycomyces sambucus TaxID=380244 RepID=A0A1G9D7X7_9ACTN|nr:DUF4333 domain-containing protein [Glycomyces sambucus]SDK59825.1 protein of unknown function [Glycomyces sambucus]
MPIRTLALLPAAIGLLGLAACSLGTPTVTAADVADAAEDALESEIGSRPEIDCGEDDSIAVEEGATVDCLLNDPATGSEFDATVTFTGVDGGEWNADVEVASEPNGGEPTEPAETESSAPPADGTSLQIEASRLAEATADALEAQMGSRPEIDCGAADLNITIYVDRQTYCSLIDPATGDEYEVTISVTKIEGDQFEFDIEVAETPGA